MRINQKGFTLIELLIVVAIIGILAAIAIPNMLDALDRSRQRATVAELHYWGLSVTAYHSEHSAFPPQAAGNLTAPVAPYVVPYTISVLKTTDAWKNPLYYFNDAVNYPESYTVASYGKDGVAGIGCTPQAWNDYRCDIILVDGIFIASP